MAVILSCKYCEGTLCNANVCTDCLRGVELFASQGMDITSKEVIDKIVARTEQINDDRIEAWHKKRMNEAREMSRAPLPDFKIG